MLCYSVLAPSTNERKEPLVPKLIRTELPEFVWEKMESIAKRDGKTIGAYAKRVLIDHVENYVEPTVSEETWAALKVWVEANPIAKHDLRNISGRVAKVEWARARGFKG